MVTPPSRRTSRVHRRNSRFYRSAQILWAHNPSINETKVSRGRLSLRRILSLQQLFFAMFTNSHPAKLALAPTGVAKGRAFPIRLIIWTSC